MVLGSEENKLNSQRIFVNSSIKVFKRDRPYWLILCTELTDISSFKMASPCTYYYMALFCFHSLYFPIKKPLNLDMTT